MHKYGTYLFAVAICFATISLSACSPVSWSHIEANVPEEADFKSLLNRDLDAYFGSTAKKKVTTEHELLRRQPTQSGVAYPKYYAWVKVLENGVVTREGAVRVAACDKVKFEVTDFVDKKQILADPEMIKQIFPAALCPAIVEHASGKQ